MGLSHGHFAIIFTYLPSIEVIKKRSLVHGFLKEQDNTTGTKIRSALSIKTFLSTLSSFTNLR